MKIKYYAYISLYDTNNVFMCYLIDMEYRNMDESSKQEYFKNNYIAFPFHSELLNYLIDDYLLNNMLIIEFSDIYIEGYDLFLEQNQKSFKNKQDGMIRLISYYKKKYASLNKIFDEIKKWKKIQDEELNYQLIGTIRKCNNKKGTDFNTTIFEIEKIFGKIPKKVYIKTYFE